MNDVWQGKLIRPTSNDTNTVVLQLFSGPILRFIERAPFLQILTDCNKISPTWTVFQNSCGHTSFELAIPRVFCRLYVSDGQITNQISLPNYKSLAKRFKYFLSNLSRITSCTKSQIMLVGILNQIWNHNYNRIEKFHFLRIRLRPTSCHWGLSVPSTAASALTITSLSFLILIYPSLITSLLSLVHVSTTSVISIF